MWRARTSIYPQWTRERTLRDLIQESKKEVGRIGGLTSQREEPTCPGQNRGSYKQDPVTPGTEWTDSCRKKTGEVNEVLSYSGFFFQEKRQQARRWLSKSQVSVRFCTELDPGPVEMRHVFMNSGDAKIQKNMGLILRINWTPHIGQRLRQGGALSLVEPGKRHSCNHKGSPFPRTKESDECCILQPSSKL